MGPAHYAKNRFKMTKIVIFRPFFEKNGLKPAFGVRDPPIFRQFLDFWGVQTPSGTPDPSPGGVRDVPPSDTFPTILPQGVPKIAPKCLIFQNFVRHVLIYVGFL